MATLKSGDDVDTYCSKCKLTLAHVIIALDGTKIAKVECKTCRSIHGVRRDPNAAPATKAPKTAATKAPRASRASKDTNLDYDHWLKDRDISRAIRYAPQGVFKEGDVLTHITFGLGVVARVQADGKIEVVFPLGAKTLIHARAAS